MFKICYLKIYYANNLLSPTIYTFGDSVYIYGANNVGKTVMLQSIDFVLGRSETIVGIDGLENISSIETKLSQDGKDLILKRSITSTYGYKYSEADDFLTVDWDLYKQEITAFLIGESDKYFEEFKKYTGEDLSFRAFSFMNFLDEKGHGNIANIFTRIDSYFHLKRARKLMSFIFNYKNVIKLINLQTEATTIQSELNALNSQKVTYNYALSLIRNEFTNLGMSISDKDSLLDMQNTFLLYKESFIRDSKKLSQKSGDLGVLLRMSFSLSEELKFQESLAQQTKYLISRNIKAERLLAALNDLIVMDNKYAPYVKDIENLIKKQQLSHDVLSIKNFPKTINEIKTKKSKIDAKIIECQKRLNKGSYEETLKAIGRIEQAFTDIFNISNLTEINNKELRLKEIQEQIKEVSNLFDESLSKKFNEKLLELYKGLNNGKIPFVKEDCDQNNFKIIFDPLKISLYGQKSEKTNETILITYCPGSMARETTWQVLSYLTLFEIIKENFSGLPILPVLFVDGLNQPYDEDVESYPNIYKYLRQTAKDLGVQLFVVSTHDGESMGIKDQLHISGFNKAHNN